MDKVYLTTSILSIVLSVFGLNFSFKNEVEDCLPEPIEIKQIEVEEEIKTDNRLVEALIQVESRGNDSCIGDRHLIIPSVGCLQIRPIMVKEVNRILTILGDDKRYKNKDRYSRVKSIEMFYIWENYHHKDDSNEIISRCWNGGPKGYKRKSTLRYWKKVQKALKKIA
jgi:hypothetical protein